MTATITTTTVVSTTTTVAELGAGAEAIIARFTEAKKLAKAAEEAKKAAEAELRAMLGDAKVGTINGVERIKISERATTTVDRELLKSAFPEAFEATVGKTPYTILTTC